MTRRKPQWPQPLRIVDVGGPLALSGMGIYLLMLCKITQVREAAEPGSDNSLLGIVIFAMLIVGGSIATIWVGCEIEDRMAESRAMEAGLAAVLLGVAGWLCYCVELSLWWGVWMLVSVPVGVFGWYGVEALRYVVWEEWEVAQEVMVSQTRIREERLRSGAGKVSSESLKGKWVFVLD